uniref:Immunoglobulin V-set domain-containing protein n=1 Tax=Scophthalmus maximus TaxID=52904 RepID=A0A8D3BTB3_SCOMX
LFLPPHSSSCNIYVVINSEFILSCKYDTNHFLFNKKYWCRGDSRGTCEILADSEHVKKTSGRFLVLDARRKGLFVKVTGLQLDDTGVYWVGIDKIYADIMTSVNVFITEGKRYTNLIND